MCLLLMWRAPVIRLQYSPSALQVSYTSMASSLQAGSSSDRMGESGLVQGGAPVGGQRNGTVGHPTRRPAQPRQCVCVCVGGGVPEWPAVHSRLGGPHGLQCVVRLAAIGRPRMIDDPAHGAGTQQAELCDGVVMWLGWRERAPREPALSAGQALLITPGAHSGVLLTRSGHCPLSRLSRHSLCHLSRMP